MTVPAQPGLAATIEPPTVVTNTTNGAQSPTPSPVAFAHGASGEKTFSAEYLARVRQEEKDKLYPKMEALESQWAEAQKTLKAIEDQRAQELAEATRLKEEKEAATKAKKEEEMSAKALLEAKLRETNETWEERFTQLQNEREAERATLAKERQYNELVDYRATQLQANVNDIAPQFHNFIMGDTKEQIDNAIAQAKAATQSILDEIRAERQQQQPQQRGVSATGYTALGPLDGTMGQKQYTAEDINNMSMAEYTKWRQEAGIANSDAQRSRGILG